MRLALYNSRSHFVRESAAKRYHRRSIADVAQLVERNLAKVEVAGSKPVVRSNHKQPRHRLCTNQEPSSHREQSSVDVVTVAINESVLSITASA